MEQPSLSSSSIASLTAARREHTQQPVHPVSPSDSEVPSAAGRIWTPSLASIKALMFGSGEHSAVKAPAVVESTDMPSTPIVQPQADAALQQQSDSSSVYPSSIRRSQFEHHRHRDAVAPIPLSLSFISLSSLIHFFPDSAASLCIQVNFITI